MVSTTPKTKQSLKRLGPKPRAYIEKTREHFERYCVTLSKPKGKAIPSFKYSIKHHGQNHFGLHYLRSIPHDQKDEMNLQYPSSGIPKVL